MYMSTPGMPVHMSTTWHAHTHAYPWHMPTHMFATPARLYTCLPPGTPMYMSTTWHAYAHVRHTRAPVHMSTPGTPACMSTPGMPLHMSATPHASAHVCHLAHLYACLRTGTLARNSSRRPSMGTATERLERLASPAQTSTTSLAGYPNQRQDKLATPSLANGQSETR